MKKVLVLAALAALVTTSAYAGSATISGTKHNLASGGGQAIKSSNLNEVCAFCHTPHAANTGATAFAPLWNRTLTDVSTATKYTSATTDAVTNAAAQLATSDAVLCLSCHDGASVGGALYNNPNVLAGSAVAGIGAVGASANIGLVLSNDHPVGFDFATVNTNDAGIKAPTDALVKVTFGASSNAMWCSSCHDVHDNTNEPFLVKSNVGSNLCLECHSK